MYGHDRRHLHDRRQLHDRHQLHNNEPDYCTRGKPREQKPRLPFQAATQLHTHTHTHTR